MSKEKLREGHVLVEVVSGAEGPSLSIGDFDTGYRVAGPKPWLAGERIVQLQLKVGHLLGSHAAAEIQVVLMLSGVSLRVVA